MKNLLTGVAFAALTTFLTSQAHAQEASPRPAPSKRPIAQSISSSMSFTVPGPVDTPEQIKAKSESARRIIYEMIESECRVLSEIFKADCRLGDVNANSSVATRREGLEGIAVTGRATYQLTPRD